MLNMKRAEILGFGLQVIYTNLTELSLSWAVNAVLNDKKYLLKKLIKKKIYEYLKLQICKKC